MPGQANPVGEGRPVWDDTVPADDLAVLDPGRPEVLPRTHDVLVIGGGQIGLATAARCAASGATVLLVERGRLAGGPSGRNGGFLLVDVARSWPAAWRELSARAFDLHLELDRACHHGLRQMDLWTKEGVVLRGQAHVNPLRVAASYARSGPTIATSVGAESIETKDGRVASVRTTLGAVTPGVVVFATGCCPPEAGSVGQSYLKGHVIATEPAGFELEKMVVNGEVGVVQLEDGRLVCGGSKDFGDDTSPVVDATVARLRAALVDLVPAAASLSISHAWSCFRPRVADDFPVIDRVPGASNAFVVAGLFSTGVLMAPVVGELVAAWIATGRAPDGVASFALDRLSRHAAHGPVSTSDVRPRA